MKEYFKNIMIKATSQKEYNEIIIKFKELGWFATKTLAGLDSNGYNKCRCDGYVFFYPETGMIYNKNTINGTVWDVDYFFKMLEHITYLENEIKTNDSTYKIKCFEADSMSIIELYMNHFISVEKISVIDLKISQCSNNICGIIYYTKNDDIGN